MRNRPNHEGAKGGNSFSDDVGVGSDNNWYSECQKPRNEVLEIVTEMHYGSELKFN